ncbi:MAG: 3'-5' exoribonuclease [Bacteroidales bacterium]|nr:3'-5' exoribonuclease [Bacteroidales bacterium]
MKNFAAIDFETANFHRTSVCSVGIVIYKNGIKVDEFYSLIKPEPEYYNRICSEVNGLSKADTENAPRFPEVWKQVVPKIAGLPLVAHNKAFDETCLKSVFGCYGMDYPDYEFYCTLLKSKELWPGIPHNLDVIAERCGFNLENHHHALADAEACAAIAVKIL